MRLTDPRPFASVRAPYDSFNIPKNENATTSPQSKNARQHDSDTEHEDRKSTLSALCKNTNIDLAAAAVENIPTPQVDVREHVFHLR